MIMDTTEKLEKLHALDRECRHLERVAALLDWDQECYLPEEGVGERAEQSALLHRWAHERFICRETGDLLAGLGSGAATPRGDPSLPELEGDFVALLWKKYDREVKLPGDFVASCVRAERLAQSAWARARRDNDFPAFLPHLETLIDLARQRAAWWGYEGSRAYDGLLDIYEPGLSQEDIAGVFSPLREKLSSILKEIASQPPPEDAFLDQDFDPDTQRRLSRRLLEVLGFDPRRGRLDESAHPFTTTLGADDVRITTRYHRRNLLSNIFSVIHEAGHAAYEMAFPPEIRGGSLADGASMGIHESQSRFWENVVGRSRPFWEGFYPVLLGFFPDQLRGVPEEVFYRAVNRVQPSLIRIEADELSYSLHIILRFELERSLFSGDLSPADLPQAWARGMEDLLGIVPETDTEGVLQDIHWSQGAFGYFPSYALGNLYGLQFRKKLAEDIPGFEEPVRNLAFGEIRRWLEEHIYRWGRRLEPAALLRKVTGESLRAEPFIDYIEGKYGALYHLPVSSP